MIEALGEQRINGGRLGEVLARLKMLSSEQVTNLLGEFLSVDSVQLDDLSHIDMNIARKIKKITPRNAPIISTVSFIPQSPFSDQSQD